MVPSLTALERIKCLYNAYCENACGLYMAASIDNLMVARGLSYNDDGIAEVLSYLDAYEYGLEPADPAFFHDVRILVNNMYNTARKYYNER